MAMVGWLVVGDRVKHPFEEMEWVGVDGWMDGWMPVRPSVRPAHSTPVQLLRQKRKATMTDDNNSNKKRSNAMQQRRNDGAVCTSRYRNRNPNTTHPFQPSRPDQATKLPPPTPPSPRPLNQSNHQPPSMVIGPGH
ncbi:hypothetical protein VTJ04DRAFT_7140 [Mycothermus thermophilus]|uniref:uncharacterized protein n=1 Tax=Humicola insolens TaxID=85995 RepID=UPI00374254B0